jgi:dolichol kinase
MVFDLLLALILSIYVLSVFYSLKFVYEYNIRIGIEKQTAIYYNRKYVHIFAGGVTAVFIPFFSSYWYPLFAGIILTIITYISHKRGGKLYWFQNNNDYNDVNFCIMWGFSIFILWAFLGDSYKWISIIPALFMSFGDGITGIIRNVFFKKRNKHPIGNIFMAIVCVPIGYYFGSFSGIAIGGIISGVIASIVELFEIGPIDDNVFITIISSLFLVIFIYFPFI